MKNSRAWAAAAAIAAMSATAQAGLVLQSNGVEVLDTDTHLLWLYDWNSSGRNGWSESKDWAAGLTVGGAAAGEWRLPEIDEYADLWIEVGSSLAGLRAAFTGVQSWTYWSGTEHPLNPDLSWNFDAGDGLQTLVWNGYFNLYAVAVRPGDVAATVPEPQTLALALLGLGATAVARRRRTP